MSRKTLSSINFGDFICVLNVFGHKNAKRMFLFVQLFFKLFKFCTVVKSKKSIWLSTIISCTSSLKSFCCWPLEFQHSHLGIVYKLSISSIMDKSFRHSQGLVFKGGVNDLYKLLSFNSPKILYRVLQHDSL